MTPMNTGGALSSNPFWTDLGRTSARITSCVQASIRLFHTDGMPFERKISGRYTSPNDVLENPYVATNASIGDAAKADVESPVVKMLRRLESIERLDRDWDSYGSDPPSPRAAGAARNLAWGVIQSFFAAAGALAVPYEIAPLSGGGVQMEWRRNERAIEVEIDPDGGYSYLVVAGDASPVRSQEKSGVSESQIKELIQSTIS